MSRKRSTAPASADCICMVRTPPSALVAAWKRRRPKTVEPRKAERVDVETGWRRSSSVTSDSVSSWKPVSRPSFASIEIDRPPLAAGASPGSAFSNLTIARTSSELPVTLMLKPLPLRSIVTLASSSRLSFTELSRALDRLPLAQRDVTVDGERLAAQLEIVELAGFVVGRQREGGIGGNSRSLAPADPGNVERGVGQVRLDSGGRRRRRTRTSR